MKKLLKRFWKGIKKAFHKLRTKAKHILPVAIKITEGVKKVMDSPVDDIVASIITNAIPGNADDILVKKVTQFVEKELPGLLIKLKLINSVAGIEDPNEQLKAIIAQLKISDKEPLNIYLHTVSAKAIEFLSDSKISWSEAVILSEIEYVETKEK